MIAKNYEVKKHTYFLQELKFFVAVPDLQGLRFQGLRFSDRKFGKLS
jgi:hypothetical protein